MPDSIREILSEELSREPDEGATTDEPAPESEAPEPAADAPDRARDEHGRFAAKPSEDEQEPAAVEAEAPPAVEAPTEFPGQETGGEVIEAPQSWSAADKEVFKTLPPEARKVIAHRESERDALLQQVSQAARQYQTRVQSIDQALAPYMPRLRMVGVNEGNLGQMIGQWAAIANALDTQPEDAIKYLAKQSGVDLSKLHGEQSQEVEDPLVVMMNQKLQEVLDPIQKQLGSITGNMTTQQQAVEIQRHQETVSEIQRFAEERDAQGNLAHPHFDTVFDDMKPLVAMLRQQQPQASNAELLSAAYDRAAWANSETRSRMLSEQRKAEEAKRKQAAEAAAAEARRKGVTVAGSMGADTGDGPVGSVGEEIRRAWRG